MPWREGHESDPLIKIIIQVGRRGEPVNGGIGE